LGPTIDAAASTAAVWSSQVGRCIDLQTDIWPAGAKTCSHIPAAVGPKCLCHKALLDPTERLMGLNQQQTAKIGVCRPSAPRVEQLLQARQVSLPRLPRRNGALLGCMHQRCGNVDHRGVVINSHQKRTRARPARAGAGATAADAPDTESAGLGYGRAMHRQWTSCAGERHTAGISGSSPSCSSSTPCAAWRRGGESHRTTPTAAAHTK
jgi:hypothetical protein